MPLDFAFIFPFFVTAATDGLVDSYASPLWLRIFLSFFIDFPLINADFPGFKDIWDVLFEVPNFVILTLFAFPYFPPFVVEWIVFEIVITALPPPTFL